MDADSKAETQVARRPTLQIRSLLRVRGAAASTFPFAILVLLATSILNMRPHYGTLLAGGVWFAFWIYWAIAA